MSFLPSISERHFEAAGKAFVVGAGVCLAMGSTSYKHIAQVGAVAALATMLLPLTRPTFNNFKSNFVNAMHAPACGLTALFIARALGFSVNMHNAVCRLAVSAVLIHFVLNNIKAHEINVPIFF